ncbi:hypothetical protein JSY36_01080 [Bacillus sp. H-16]|uniref:DUF5983 family protein n=1 Tax=Alteribacter salitolerans TaxID=2912333 RepID=UPI001964773A|nr:hypothetical protein [Alteribacter salitolerans]MBM7094334.1 hypothetical protein [Alteribacter salitolerans]
MMKTSENLEIRNTKTISKEELTKAALEDLQMGVSDLLVTYPKGEKGWYVYFTDFTEEDVKELPKSFRKVARECLKNNTYMLVVDSDINKNESPKHEKMITLSTGHVSEKTAAKLAYRSFEGLNVYQKRENSWFIETPTPDNALYRRLPDDLIEVLKFAHRHECAIVCLDQDGGLTNKLTEYDW